jgi:hypothetical protein
MKYLFSGQPDLRRSCEQLLRVQPNQVSAEHLLQDMTQQVRRWGPAQCWALDYCMQSAGCSMGCTLTEHTIEDWHAVL